MIIVVAISPVVLVALAIVVVLGMHIGAGTIVALAAICGASLIISLAICAVIAAKMNPPRRGYQASARYTADTLPPPPASLTVYPHTAISASRETSAIEPPRTYKRMVGRRVVEYDMATHRPIRRHGET